MSKPNSFSVTRIRCSCGYLARKATDPNLPIRFDAELNEYSFEYTLPGGSKVSMMIYHSPMCGGVASESKRAELFAAVPKREALRLKAIIDDLNTVQDIENTLGAADEDTTYCPPSDFVEIQPRSGMRETKSIRVLNFTRLSDTADVQFSVYSNGEIERSIAGKYLGGSGSAADLARKRRRRPSRAR
jgi:hypothetical protein